MEPVTADSEVPTVPPVLVNLGSVEVTTGQGASASDAHLRTMVQALGITLTADAPMNDVGANTVELLTRVLPSAFPLGNDYGVRRALEPG